MSTILRKGVIRRGQVIVEEPIDLPDGTEVVVTSGAAALDDFEDGWDSTPEGIAAWLKWCDSLQPLKITPQEEADADAWLRRMNDYGSANLDKGIEDLFR